MIVSHCLLSIIFCTSTYDRTLRWGLPGAASCVEATLFAGGGGAYRPLFMRLEKPVLGRPSLMARGPVGAPTTPTPIGSVGWPVRTVAAPYAPLLKPPRGP
jgi:hypothetical protein